jgi:hypothetical protein
VNGHAGGCSTRRTYVENAIDISGGAMKVVYLVDSVGKQSAVPDKVRYRIDRRYVVSGRRAPRERERIRRDDGSRGHARKLNISCATLNL